MLVSRVLSLLAAETNGMNSEDIINILSCDEELLKDVLVWHEPPKRRLPPLLLARLKHDLGPFLVERGAFGVSLLALFHRYFVSYVLGLLKGIMPIYDPSFELSSIITFCQMSGPILGP